MKLSKTGKNGALRLILGATLLAAAACGDDGSEAGEAAVTDVTFRGPFVTSGGDAPIYYARELGYYAEEGLDVEIRDSKGSSQTVTDVNSGGSDFGMAAATSVMLAVAQGQEVVSVATAFGGSSFGFFVPDDSGIASIDELRGASIAVTAFVEPIMYAALSTAGLSAADVDVVVADPNALVSTYLSGDVDSMYTVTYLEPAVARRPSTVLLQSDVGFNPPDYSLLVAESTLNDRPEMVRGFVRATLRGVQAARENPDAAIEALLAEHPELEPDQARGTLLATLDFACSPAQAGIPYGQHAAEDWTVTAQALQEFAALDGSTEGDRFFTNSLFEGDDGLDVATC